MTETRSAGTPATSGRGRSAAGSDGTASRNPVTWVVGLVTRVWRYLLECSAEVRKAVRPTRSELITYTTVVLVFVSFIIAVVYGLDLGFSKAVFEIFGG